MNAAQIAFAREWKGPIDESYVAGMADLDREPAWLAEAPEPEEVAPEPVRLPVAAPGPSTRLSVAAGRPEPRNVGRSPEPEDVDHWIVEGVIRPGALVIVAAGEGLGKSYIRKELAIRLATGSGALFGHYLISEPVTVLDFDEENGPDEEWRRESEVIAALGLDREATDARYWSTSFAGITLTDPGAQDYIRAQIARLRPAVVMFDTGTGMVGDEWGVELKTAIRFLRSLIVTYGCAVVVFVHLTKPPRETKGAGSVRHGGALSHVMGQWPRQADAVALMADLGAGRATWAMRKRVPPSSLVIRQAGGLWEVVHVNEAAEVRPSSVDTRVLRAIAGGADRPDDIATGLSVAVRSVYTAVRRLRRDGLLTEDFPYRTTPAGAESLEAA